MVREKRRLLGSQIALELVADKWIVLIIHALDGRKKRYGELRKRIPGISQRMLTLTLRHLERDGLVERKVYPVTPPRTEYALTRLGHSVVPSLRTLCRWAERHFKQVRAHRLRFARATGRSLPVGRDRSISLEGTQRR